ncbi:MAG: hypothetical protein KDA78_02560 [Planctomycetaceae bacterium]|nr:hypothetical protein [Planctomycetaceae bacterium]
MSSIHPGLQGSLALIRNRDAPEQEWLLFWEEQNQQYETIVAHRLERESFRECLDREIAWQLDWRRGKDYLISHMARLHIEQELQLPGDEKPLFYLVEAIVVDPYGKATREAIRHHESAVWLKAADLYQGTTSTGKAIDPRLVALITRFELIYRSSV